MYHPDDFIHLSSLQHFAFCQRQCALIHIEQIWTENIFTAEGRILHERVHEQGGETRAGIRIERGFPLRSLRLGLIGKADLIEFHHIEKNKWTPFPVEYKRGKPKSDRCDEVQLCAQAICLEEMMGADVQRGAIFYGKIRHRHEVAFDSNLRNETEETARKVHDLIDSGITPEPIYEKRCQQCSLISYCLPKSLSKRKAVEGYLLKIVDQ